MKNDKAQMKKVKRGNPDSFYGSLPLNEAVLLGMQHIMAMFVGNLTPLIIILGACGITADAGFAELRTAVLQNSMTIAGIVTLVQLFSIGPCGGKVPIIMGTSSGFLGVFQSVVATMGQGVIAYGTILGASLIGGLFEGVLGACLKPFSGCIEGGMNREATDKELSGGIICDGLGSAFASLFGVLPNTSFSQNVGLVSMTKVVNRMALSCGAIFLILCGLCPKIAACVSIMPQPVLGGAAVIMFASILVSGIKMVTQEPIGAREITIISVALGLGYGLGSTSGATSAMPQAVQLIFGGSGIVPAAFAAIILNVVLPKQTQ